MGGEGVTQGVRAHASAGQSDAGVALHHGPGVSGRHALLPPVEEQGVLPARARLSAGQEHPPPACKVLRERLGREVPHRDDPLFSAFAHHPNPLAFDVQVVEVQPARLGYPQPRAVQQFEHGPVAQTHGVGRGWGCGQSLRLGDLQDPGEP